MAPAAAKVTRASMWSSREAACACIRRCIGVAPLGARNSSFPGYLRLSASSRCLFVLFFPEAQISCVSTWLGLSACGRLWYAAASCVRLRQAVEAAEAAAGCSRLREAAAGRGLWGILGRFWTFLPNFLVKLAALLEKCSSCGLNIANF